MNNLHRELAPISDPAWAQITDEATRTFKRHLAGRRVVDLSGPTGSAAAAVSTGHLTPIDAPTDGVRARRRTSLPMVELRVPFRVSRDAVDDVERGAQDSDWQPVKDAAKKVAWAEDRAIFEGYPAGEIQGLREFADGPGLILPTEAKDYPDAITEAMTRLRLAGVDGPYALLLSAQAYTKVVEAADHGYPVREHLSRVVDQIIWATAVDGAFVLTTRGGDFELFLGQDLSIGYSSHDAESVELYFQETLTFAAYTSESAVALS